MTKSSWVEEVLLLYYSYRGTRRKREKKLGEPFGQKIPGRRIIITCASKEWDESERVRERKKGRDFGTKAMWFNFHEGSCGRGGLGSWTWSHPIPVITRRPRIYRGSLGYSYIYSGLTAVAKGRALFPPPVLFHYFQLNSHSQRNSCELSSSHFSPVSSSGATVFIIV